MKLLLFSDLHLDAPFQWAGPDAARLRRRNLRATLKRIVQLAADLEVEALCCGGDLYEHDRFSPDTGAFLREAFAAIAPTPVLLAPGNHDWYGPSSLYRQVEWSPNVTVFSEAELTPVVLEEGCTVWGAGHRAPSATRSPVEGFHADRGGVNLALFHGSEMSGLTWQEPAKVPHAPFRAEEIPAAGFDMALLGHYHRPVMGSHHVYPGNPDPLAFGEVGERGAVLVTLGTRGIDLEHHMVASSTVDDVVVDLTGISHVEEGRERVRSALAECQGFVRCTLEGEVAPEVEVDPSDFTADALAPHLEALATRLDRIRVAEDIDALATEATIRGQFVRDVLSAPGLEEEERQRVLVVGLRALAGRDDLDVS